MKQRIRLKRKAEWRLAAHRIHEFRKTAFIFGVPMAKLLLKKFTPNPDLRMVTWGVERGGSGSGRIAEYNFGTE